MKRYEQGSVGMRPDPEGSWCEYQEAQAEIERLRNELAVEKGWVSQYRDSYCKQIIEIERLRGLLREAMSPPVRLRVLPQGADWIRRVREALGE